MRGLEAVALAVASCVVAAELGCSASSESHAGQEPPSTLQLIVVSDLEGVLEPCGCGGHVAGGVDRVVAAVDALRMQRPDSMVLAIGALFADERGSEPDAFRDAAQWKADAMRDVLRRLRPEGSTTPTAAVSGTLLEASSLPASKAIGLASAPWPSGAAELRAEIAALRQRGATMVIAAVHGGADAPEAALGTLDADLILQSGVSTAQASTVKLGERCLLVRPAPHGEAVTKIELPLHGRRDAVRVQHHVLDQSAPQDPEVRAWLTALFARIDAHHRPPAALAAEREDPAEVARGALRYVGSETCAACHTEAYYWWRSSPHGRALATLTARGRQRDPECVGCHVTGWDEGAPTLRGLEQRAGVGCESCHGPGSAHVDNPRPPHRGLVREVPEARCIACHDREHSRPFDYTLRRAALLTPAHGGR